MRDDNYRQAQEQEEQQFMKLEWEKRMKVYKAINEVQRSLSKIGITKSQKNAQQGYPFRGIDDCLNALSPLLSQHGLVILPRMISRTVEERQTRNGGMLNYVTVEAEYDLVCADDGSKHTIKTFGEAMDSADKATNKAMSAAYKYAVLQTFCIPTEGDNDADAHSHDVRVETKKGPELDMDTVLMAMREAPGIEELKHIFGEAWKVATEAQKKELKFSYDHNKSVMV